jgi:hypothetical protein
MYQRIMNYKTQRTIFIPNDIVFYLQIVNYGVVENVD